ncbi:MAG: flagellar biosynthesis protein FlhA [Planctomycetota bacterium]|nr:MAG: flagellar biosynthesis protein FlhA [Planctomycetota bacterium]
MAKAAATTLDRLLAWTQKYMDVFLPMAFFAMILVIFVPLPASLMDVLLIINIALAGLILVTTVYVAGPLHFSVFPSLLLGTTAFRLILNIATTRLILANAGDKGEFAAGVVIRTFGEYVAGGSVMIGLIIFAIIIIVQFVVITKGATRIAEVAARFTLDGMPGKQMAIDADLNAGILTQEEARIRRERITSESDFYGAMDGASKFVRGDAIAGILITLVNIVGGLIIGVFSYDMDWGRAFNLFTRLTIGDGLVSQIPALIISISAGLIVTRASTDENLGASLFGQLFSVPRAMLITGAFLGVLMFTPMPKIPLMVVGASIIGIGLIVGKVAEARVRRAAEDEEAAVPPPEPEKVEQLLRVDPIELEVGYGLIRMVDANQGGELLERVTLMRRQTALTTGLVIPPIRIRDNMQLKPNEYVLRIQGVEVGRGEAIADEYLAINPSPDATLLDGTKTKDPAFGFDAYWVPESQKPRAEALGYTCADATAVVATHLSEILKRHAAELLTREETKRLVDALKEASPAVVEEVIPSTVKMGELQKVLQNLLKERVSIRNLEAILEVLGDYAPQTRDLEVLTEYVRMALAPQIVQDYRDADGKLYVVAVDPRLEDEIARNIRTTDRGSYNTLPPQTVNAILEAAAREIKKLLDQGRPQVIIANPLVRRHLRNILERELPQVAVLSLNEISKETSSTLEAVGWITLESPANAPAA